jgi:leukotriene-A4 hydrolase
MSKDADPTTQSNYFDVHTTHIDLEIDVDFEKKVLKGSVTHTVNVVKAGVKEVM